MLMTKRDLLAGGGASLACAAALPSSLASQTSLQSGDAKSPSGDATSPGAAPPLTSDIGQLDRVLVHSLRETDGLTTRISTSVIPYVDYDLAGAVEQQQALMGLLKDAGAELVEFHDALEAARTETLANGVFEAWVDAYFPRLGGMVEDITTDMLLGRDANWLYRLDQHGDYAHYLDAMNFGAMWTRDSAFMTPAGLVIANSNSPRRGRENMLLRFAYRYSPILRDAPVALDAVEQGFIVEGGDAIVVDSKTMFLGVGNRSTPEAARILAQRLDMDVIAVQIGTDEFLREVRAGESRDLDDLRLLFLHLDTSFTLVGPKHALALPYIFEAARADDNPLSRYIRGALRQSLMSREDAEKGLELLKGIGTLTRYASGTGKEEKLEGVKLVDYCRAEGYKITNTGGPIPDGDEAAFAHFMRTTYPEQRRQASNVVQATPGRVIAFDGNPATTNALRADGVEVDAFHARDLWHWHGGPHCLTQPLKRS